MLLSARVLSVEKQHEREPNCVDSLLECVCCLIVKLIYSLLLPYTNRIFEIVDYWANTFYFKGSTQLGPFS